MTKWENTRIPIDQHGMFTRLDHSLMNKRELAERKRIVEERIAEYEEELALIESREVSNDHP